MSLCMQEPQPAHGKVVHLNFSIINTCGQGEQDNWQIKWENMWKTEDKGKKIKCWRQGEKQNDWFIARRNRNVYVWFSVYELFFNNLYGLYRVSTLLRRTLERCQRTTTTTNYSSSESGIGILG